MSTFRAPSASSPLQYVYSTCESQFADSSGCQRPAKAHQVAVSAQRTGCASIAMFAFI